MINSVKMYLSIEHSANPISFGTPPYAWSKRKIWQLEKLQPRKGRLFWGGTNKGNTYYCVCVFVFWGVVFWGN